MASIDATFVMLREELHGLRQEMRDLRSDFSSLQDRLVQIGFGLVGVLIAAMVALIIVLA